MTLRCCYALVDPRLVVIITMETKPHLLDTCKHTLTHSHTSGDEPLTQRIHISVIVCDSVPTVVSSLSLTALSKKQQATAERSQGQSRPCSRSAFHWVNVSPLWMNPKWFKWPFGLFPFGFSAFFTKTDAELLKLFGPHSEESLANHESDEKTRNQSLTLVLSACRRRRRWKRTCQTKKLTSVYKI